MPIPAEIQEIIAEMERWAKQQYKYAAHTPEALIDHMREWSRLREIERKARAEELEIFDANSR